MAGDEWYRRDLRCARRASEKDVSPAREDAVLKESSREAGRVHQTRRTGSLSYLTWLLTRPPFASLNHLTSEPLLLALDAEER